jgi:hypothetical protein
MRVTEATKLGTRFESPNVKCCPPPPRDENSLSLPFQVIDVNLKLLGIESGPRVELHRPFRRVLVGRGEGNDDDVPLRRYFPKRKNGTGSSVSAPIPDQLVTDVFLGARCCRQCAQAYEQFAVLTICWTYHCATFARSADFRLPRARSLKEVAHWPLAFQVEAAPEK